LYFYDHLRKPVACGISSIGLDHCSLLGLIFGKFNSKIDLKLFKNLLFFRKDGGGNCVAKVGNI